MAVVIGIFPLPNSPVIVTLLVPAKYLSRLCPAQPLRIKYRGLAAMEFFGIEPGTQQLSCQRHRRKSEQENKEHGNDEVQHQEGPMRDHWRLYQFSFFSPSGHLDLTSVWATCTFDWDSCLNGPGVEAGALLLACGRYRETVRQAVSPPSHTRPVQNRPPTRR